MTPGAVAFEGWLSEQPQQVYAEGWLAVDVPVFVTGGGSENPRKKKPTQAAKLADARKLDDDDILMIAAGFLVGDCR
jgi:hypothetical protein